MALLCVQLLVLLVTILLVSKLGFGNKNDEETEKPLPAEYQVMPVLINDMEHAIQKFVALDSEEYWQRQVFDVSRNADVDTAVSAKERKQRLQYYRNMSHLLGVGKVHRCPFEYIQAYAPYDPVVIINRAVETLFKQGSFQAALACIQFSLKVLTSGEVAAEDPHAMKTLIQNTKENIKNMKFLLTAPKQMITKRIFHIPSSAKYPHFSNKLVPPELKKRDKSIMVFDGALSRMQCQHIIGLFEASELYQGNVYDGKGGFAVDTDNKNVWEFDISGTAPNDPIWAAVDRLMVSVTIKHLIKYEQYNHGMNAKISPLADGGFQMKRYRPRSHPDKQLNVSTSSKRGRNSKNSESSSSIQQAEHHAFHIDASHFPHCGEQRLIAVIVYLNDVEEGGETVFYNQGLVVKPKCGRVLMFPTALEYAHAGRQPISNTKYDIIGFIME
jgi:hypothetical protein